LRDFETLGKPGAEGKLEQVVAELKEMG